MTSEPDNIDRAVWARRAANVFSKETMNGRTFDQLIADQGTGEDTDTYCVLQDLITDTLHLAQQTGWDAEELIRRAVGTFEEELAEADD